MKRLLALLLTAVLLLTALPALASETVTLKYLGDSKIALDSGDTLKGFEVTYKGASTTLTVTVTDLVQQKSYSEGSYSVRDGEKLTVPMHQYGEFKETDKPRAMRVTFETASGHKERYTVYQMSQKENGAYYLHQLKPEYYTNNTASSFGPHLRNLTPNLTDKWYMVTPIDLTVQGRQTYELVGSNVYVIGEVYVDVAGDTVTLSYYNYYDKYAGDTKTTKEFVKLYHSYDEIKADDFENAALSLRFNQPLSIAYDLNGDTSVLMLVINRVDYCSFPTIKNMLRRFWENTPENKALRESLEKLIDWDGKNDPTAPVDAEPTVQPPAEG